MPQVRQLTRWQYARVFVGLAAQPLAAAAFGFTAYPWITEVDPASTDGAVSIAAGAALVALLVTVAVAAPAVAWKLDCGTLSFRQVMTGGALIGVVPVLVLLLLAAAAGEGSGGGAVLGLIRVLLTGAAFGLWGAAVFWFVALWRSSLAAAT